MGRRTTASVSQNRRVFRSAGERLIGPVRNHPRLSRRPLYLSGFSLRQRSGARICSFAADEQAVQWKRRCRVSSGIGRLVPVIRNEARIS
jgi:hypothetical protein